MDQVEIFERDLALLGVNQIRTVVLNDMTCVIRRVDTLHLRGYVEVDDDVDPEIIDCHGGITFDRKEVHGFPTDSRYIGFDCAHAGDWVPGLWSSGVYRDVGFVLGELYRMTAQLKGEIV
ncbi:hypothetical protein JEQ21_03560 [Streptococcus sp. 121]|uniref:hypothetical protein n=1 Tax=Streptococcus sp. 121 TaxID=2797637 RepID=UPI0018F08283|nr:hypothetical protein [Streptococcus sp. 121]MBJ6745550.1 hypothetical protein [Streptococcus sp. 121]